MVVNQAIVFRVETFEPTEDFNPAKPYKTRLKWCDLAGNEQSKLLLTEPATLISEMLKSKGETRPTAKRPGRRPQRGSSGSRRMEAYRS